MPMPVMDQVVAIYAGGKGYLDSLPVERRRAFPYRAHRLPACFQAGYLRCASYAEKKLTDAIEADLNAAIEAFKLSFAVIGVR